MALLHRSEGGDIDGFSTPMKRRVPGGSTHLSEEEVAAV